MKSQNQTKTAGSRWLVFAFLILSAVGMTDATYLTVKYYKNLKVGCVSLGDCEKVTSSVYSTISGVPIALLGAIYYFIILASVILFLYFLRKWSKEHSPLDESRANSIWDFFTRFTIIGFLVSAWLVYLQLFVIHAICIYCVISALTSTALFILSAFAIFRNRNQFISG